MPPMGGGFVPPMAMFNPQQQQAQPQQQQPQFPLGMGGGFVPPMPMFNPVLPQYPQVGGGGSGCVWV